jgi:hypothetical protein
MFKTLTRLLVVIPAAISFCGTANAETAVDETGVIVCANDKWDEKEIAKGHKVVDYGGRCVKVPDDTSAPKTSETCTGKYEYLPDGSWKASGTCAAAQKDGDTFEVTWEEGSALKENPYKATSGTGKFKGISGGGTYKYDQVSETLFGGRYHSKFQLP